MNLIDAAAIMPYFFTLGLDRIMKAEIRNNTPQIATVLRMVRVLRTLRILKLSRYSRGLRILGTTLYRSARVLTLLVIFQVLLSFFANKKIIRLFYTDGTGDYVWLICLLFGFGHCVIDFALVAWTLTVQQ